MLINKNLSKIGEKSSLNEEYRIDKFKYRNAELSIKGLIINIILIITLLILLIKAKINNKYLKKVIKELKINKKLTTNSNVENISFDYNYYYYNVMEKEANSPQLKELSKKRILEKRLPLPKEIKCKPHLKREELMAFLSLLTKETIFFETGSGCSSIIAKYFSKKSYAVEGCKHYYEFGIKNGLKNNLIFKNLKPDNLAWSYPGSKSNIEDWKNYFQSYKKEYNADVILIDGRFKVATAMDIFNKIRDDTIILLHEYNRRPLYFILEKYYKYIYHWGSLFAFVKKKEVKEIPIEIQKKYWNKFL